MRLNNYWRIKSARWNGKIASDAEGHVAFSSAHERAVVAAQLLRRYYVNYGHRSALAIVSRWAPSEYVAAAAVPRIACAGEGVRIRNYAAALAKGVADGPLDDLKLFDDKGLPTPALAQAMANMAAVEIGPMKAAPGLIERAVETQTALLRERMETQPPPIDLPPTPPPSGIPPGGENAPSP